MYYKIQSLCVCTHIHRHVNLYVMWWSSYTNFAFGVWFNLNRHSQSPWSLFNGTHKSVCDVMIMVTRSVIAKFRRICWVSKKYRWRRLIGFPKLQIIFHKRATKYMSLLRKMTYKDKGSYESLPLCIMHTQFLKKNVAYYIWGKIQVVYMQRLSVHSIFGKK